jgi:Leucine-rich repeat (LRR) protein
MGIRDPVWLVNSLLQAVARLPKLTELAVQTTYRCNIRVPLGSFSNLSKLSVSYSRNDISLFNISQVAVAIANSPQLRCLDVHYWGWSSPTSPPPTLSDLFAKLSPENPLYLEQLHLLDIDATMNELTLPHLTHLTSFKFEVRELDFTTVQSVWDSLLANDVELSDVFIDGYVTPETISYLSSFSGLKRLAMGNIITPPDMTLEIFKNRLFEEVLPKHINSLQELVIPNNHQWVKTLFFRVTSSLADPWGDRFSILLTHSRLSDALCSVVFVSTST